MYYETFTSFIELFGIVSGGYSQMELSPSERKIYFIDEQDGNQAKVLSNADEVNIIKFGARAFYPEQDGGVEIVVLPPFY